jgi:hypothetical protein
MKKKTSKKGFHSNSKFKKISSNTMHKIRGGQEADSEAATEEMEIDF